MQIDSSVIQTAASSQLGRLELRSANGNQTCVCNKSFSGWVVHVLRYKFSKNYRKQEQETRRQILTATLGNGNEEFTLSDVQRNSLLDRRRFNRYINAELKELANCDTTGHEEPNVIPPSTSAQTSRTDETLVQATQTVSTEKTKPKTSLPTEVTTKPEKATFNQAKTTTPISTTGKTAASTRPITTEVLTLNYADTKSDSDNQTWIAERDLLVRDHLKKNHVAAIFCIGADWGRLFPDLAISDVGGKCVLTVATLEKRIGERLEQYNPEANANTKHFLTFLTLRKKRASLGGDSLFEIEEMKKSSPTATWSDDFKDGGILGVPLDATECGRVLPTETLMFCANKVISKLPVETKTEVFQSGEGSEARRLVDEMYEYAGYPEYRKEFSPDGQELTQEEFKWLLDNVKSFGAYCNRQ